MKKHKIAVYAITKNEEKHVDRWVNSMKEADAIYVLDTASTDKTVEKLKKYKNVYVTTKKFNLWRFDKARNESLAMVPEEFDICVCTDLDEVFEKGWRKKLEDSWKKDTTRAQYNYNWSLDENNKPIVNFYISKIHSRNNYHWTHPVHEVLTPKTNLDNVITINDITLNHYPDEKKSRSSYLPLLELSVKEEPMDDRNVHYLGREYMYYGRWNEAIDTLIKHLSLPTALWKDERCASMRFIGRCYKKMGRYEESKMWYQKACIEASYLRDPYIEGALLYYELEDWENVIDWVKKALTIKTKAKSYINEVFSWNETPYDLLAISYYNIGNYVLAYKYSTLALKENPEDERLKKNKSIIKEKLNSI